jgi:uncharacterized membrane protein YhiD involved in acid resistance
MHQFRRLHGQRGTSLLGLFLIAVVVGFFALMAMRCFPAINEYLTVRKALNQIMKNGPANAEDIRRSFERQTEVEYSISTVKASDLEITQVNDRLVVHVKYDKEIEIMDPVYLLLKFDHTAKSAGNGP